MGKTLLDRASMFKGTVVDGLVLNHLLVPTVQLPGPPIGITVDANHTPVGLDMELLKELLEQLEVRDIGIIADQGIGKTFTICQLVSFWCTFDVGSDTPFRFKFNSLKRNNRGRPETAPLIEDLLKCKIIDPRTAVFNVWSRAWKFTFDEKYAMALSIYQYVHGSLSLAAQQVLKEVMKQAEEDQSRDPSFPVYTELFEHYNPPGAVELDEIQNDSDSESEGSKPAWMTTRFLGQKERQFSKLYDAAFDLKLATETFNEGLYGNILNGTEVDTAHTIHLFSQRAVSVDYKNIPDEVRSVLEIIWAHIEMMAETPWPTSPEQGPRMPELIYHAIVTDEAYQDWENPEFVESEYKRKKTQRETGIIGVMIFHRLRDFLEAIGNDKTSRKARNAISEVKVWLIGRQDASSRDDLIQFFGLPDHVLDSLPTLAKGHFWLILPGAAPILIAIIGTQIAIKYFSTEDAHAHLLRRYFETGDTKYYITYLEKTTPEPSEGDDNESNSEEDS